MDGILECREGLGLVGIIGFSEVNLPVTVYRKNCWNLLLDHWYLRASPGGMTKLG